MDALVAARWQMAVSLGFHMIFAALGIGMPLLMLLAEWKARRGDRPECLALARTWAKVTALLFAIGAVSGTALSFELGLLWPSFMELAGGVVGSAFALEGFAFFLEAIFLALYLYGWERLSARAHWWCGVPVAFFSMLSGVLVLSANAWMHTPAGFTLLDGKVVDTDPIAALFNPSFATLALHSTLSVYVATGFGVAAVHAAGILRGRDGPRHREGLRLALLVGGVAALLQPLSGDISARAAAEHQPAKLAAMEAHFVTGPAPLAIGGWPDVEARELRGALEVPGLLSLLLHGSRDATVVGLDAYPRADWPDVPLVRTAFSVMVAIGVLLPLVALWAFAARRWTRLQGRPLLLAVSACGVLAFVALEAGWIVTEAGRQPWIVQDVMRTADAVTPSHDVGATLAIFSLLYLFLGATLVVLLRRIARASPAETSRDAD